jgi:pimeloyl-ACP methyl ester carboxylesterase
LALLATALLAGCAPRAAGPERRVQLAPCHVKGVAAATLCGTWQVPEDRDAPAGRKIALRVAVVPALARVAQPDPLFMLAGGPGQGAVEGVGPLLPALERIHRQRDIVLVDQRGTGQSEPLACELSDEDAPLALRMRDEGFPAERLRACLASYRADPRLFTTPIAMQDLDAVREALGYERINLWGGSYGTRAALVYMRAYPQRVRLAVLDGAAPYSIRLPLHFARDGQRSLDLLFESCAKEAACARAFPDLRSRFGALLGRLEKQPFRGTVADPVSGEPQQVTISHDVFAAGLRGILYLPEMATLVPLMVDRAERGDFTAFLAASQGLQRGISRNMALGMFFSVICAEDVPFIEPSEVDALSRGTFFGPALTRELIAACQVWPRGRFDPALREPVKVDVPTLVLSGELDPATPPVWGDEVAKALPRSLHLVVPGVGHGATAQGCVPRLLAEALDRGEVAGLDASCVKKLGRPPFFVSVSGTTP